MKRIIGWWTVVLALALGGAACDKDREEEAPVEDPAEPAAEEAPAPASTAGEQEPEQAPAPAAQPAEPEPPLVELVEELRETPRGLVAVGEPRCWAGRPWASPSRSPPAPTAGSRRCWARAWP